MLWLDSGSCPSISSRQSPSPGECPKIKGEDSSARIGLCPVKRARYDSTNADTQGLFGKIA